MSTDQGYQFRQFDDDSSSTGNDSGYSMDQDDIQLGKEKNVSKDIYENPVMMADTDTETDTTATTTASINHHHTNFITRFAFIPIVQDSLNGAHMIVRQYPVGQKALDYAETALSTIATSAQPYLPSTKSVDRDGSLLYRVNSLGNKSLDLLEKQFPIMVAPTSEMVQPFTDVKEHIGLAVHRIREKTNVNPGIDYLANQLETILDQYLPDTVSQRDRSTDEASDEKHGVDRLMGVAHIISSRISQRLAKANPDADEEKQLREIVSSWIMEHANTMSQQQWNGLQEQLDTLKTRMLNPLHSAYEFTAAELDKLHQELSKPDMSPIDRIRNVLVLSQNDLIKPVLRKYLSAWNKDHSSATNDVRNEESIATN